MDEVNPGLIFIPVTTLVFWTLIILLTIPFRRFRSIFSGRCGLDDFKEGESDNVPESVLLANRNYMNLLELPVIFYLVCILFFITSAVSQIVLGLAGLYVTLRMLHSLVHITYNNVLHRFWLFACSNVVLLGIWILWVFSLMQGNILLT